LKCEHANSQTNKADNEVHLYLFISNSVYSIQYKVYKDSSYIFIFSVSRSLFKNLTRNLNSLQLKTFSFYNDFLLTGSFARLPKEDQENLLKENSALYVQYILAQYFSIENGQEQLEWITETKLPDEKSSNLIRITVEDFNRSCHLFPSTETEELFAQLSGNVGRFFPVVPL
jgi:hypothetical protein